MSLHLYGVEPSWERMLSLPGPSVLHPPWPPPHQLAGLFGGHEASYRTWSALLALRVFELEDLIALKPLDLQITPNTGRVTWGEVARLRAAVLAAHDRREAAE